MLCCRAASRQSIHAPQLQVESGPGRGRFPEELLQDADDAAGFGQVAVLCPRILQQHIPVSAALQEEAAAIQGVVTHLCLTHEALQAVHVLDGLCRVRVVVGGQEETSFIKKGKQSEQKTVEVAD